MAEVSFNIRNFNVLKIRLDPTDVHGQNSAGQPFLNLPLKLQLLPAVGPQQQYQPPPTALYNLVRLAGTVSSHRVGELAGFELGPLADPANPMPIERNHVARIALDRTRIRGYEDSRAGSDAELLLSFSALVWFPALPSSLEVVRADQLRIVVPKSHWAERVVEPWGLESIKVVEIRFPSSAAGDTFRTSYERIEGAERSFANGLYKQVLTELRQSFEALALGLGYEGRMKECFESLFAGLHPDKKQKALSALTSIYRFMHLGPHEQNSQPDSNGQPVITRQDARFLLTLAHAVFEYITPQG